MSVETSMGGAAKILVLDDLPFRRACIANLLSPYYHASGYELSAHSIADAPLAREAGGVILLVVGHEASDLRTIQGIANRIVIAESPMALVVLATIPCEHDFVRDAFQLGASAFLTSDMDPSLVLRALDLVAAGGHFCSPETLATYAQTLPTESDGEKPEAGTTLRQQEVVRHLREGLSNKSIARRMMISEATVKIHIRHIMRRMGVQNRTQIAVHSQSASAQSASAF